MDDRREGLRMAAEVRSGNFTSFDEAISLANEQVIYEASVRRMTADEVEDRRLAALPQPVVSSEVDDIGYTYVTVACNGEKVIARGFRDSGYDEVVEVACMEIGDRFAADMLKIIRRNGGRDGQRGCGSRSLQRRRLARMTDLWAIEDTWSSIIYALALVNGDDPDAAVAYHREWCERYFRPRGEGGDDR